MTQPVAVVVSHDMQSSSSKENLSCTSSTRRVSGSACWPRSAISGQPQAKGAATSAPAKCRSTMASIAGAVPPS